VNFHVIPRHENLLVFRLVDKMVFHEFPHVVSTVTERRTLLQGAASNTGPSKTFPTGFGAGLPLGGPTGWKLIN
jgi:hypothetical protein